MSLPVEVHEQSAPQRIGAAIGVGFAAGALTGAVASSERGGGRLAAGSAGALVPLP